MFSTRIATQIYAKICFNTTSGQKKIIESLSEYLSESDPAAIFVLNGYAGTGKTTLIAALVGALKDCGIKPVLLAPTGRAAKVLSRYSGEPALTIHKRIYRQRTNADYEKYDLLIGMDSANLRDMYRICGGDYAGKMSLLMDHTTRPGNVADPWYTEDFEATWRDVLEGCQGLLEELAHDKV